MLTPGLVNDNTYLKINWYLARQCTGVNVSVMVNGTKRNSNNLANLVLRADRVCVVCVYHYYLSWDSSSLFISSSHKNLLCYLISASLRINLCPTSGRGGRGGGRGELRPQHFCQHSPPASEKTSHLVPDTGNWELVIKVSCVATLLSTLTISFWENFSPCLDNVPGTGALNY